VALLNSPCPFRIKPLNFVCNSEGLRPLLKQSHTLWLSMAGYLKNAAPFICVFLLALITIYLYFSDYREKKQLVHLPTELRGKPVFSILAAGDSITQSHPPHRVWPLL